MRRHGESDKPMFLYLINRFASYLKDLLNRLKLKDIEIVAHSIGYSITWAFWD